MAAEEKSNCVGNKGFTRVNQERVEEHAEKMESFEDWQVLIRRIWHDNYTKDHN